MKWGGKREESAQLGLLGDLDRTEHTPQVTASPNAQRWTTREQVDMLLAHPRIQEVWPTGDYVAADPCAGTGQLMRYVDAVATSHGLVPPRYWGATELDAKLARSPARYRGALRHGVLRGKGYSVAWETGDAARLEEHAGVRLVITNLPWFNVFARLVGHWRDVAFPNALVIALCDDQERTRESARRWLEAGNMPALIAQLPGRQSFDGAEDGAYPWSVSWYVWRPGERRTTSEVILL